MPQPSYFRYSVNMPIQKSEALVLRRQDLRETSLIVTFYTRDFGKIKGIMRGVRGARAQLPGGALQLFALDSIIFYERKRGDIYTVSQCDLVEFFNPLRESLERLSYAAYIMELLDSVTSLGDVHPEVFDLAVNSLRLMTGESSARRVARIFEIKLLSLLGIMPELTRCSICGSGLYGEIRFSYRHGGLICPKCAAVDRGAQPILAGTIKFIEHVRNYDFEKVARVKVASEVGRELEQILRKFLDYHIERRLKTVEFIKETLHFS